MSCNIVYLVFATSLNAVLSSYFCLIMIQNVNNDFCNDLSIPHFRSFKKNGYKFLVQWLLGLFGWTSVGYDWSIVFKATNDQS